MIKSIDTQYNGRYFRSRTEARWAIYFETLGVSYEYEKEGYVLNDGTKYLPDFYFPKYEMYAEIKGLPFTEEEHNKCVMLAELTKCKVLKLVGLPSLNLIEVIVICESSVCSKCGKTPEIDWDNGSRIDCKCGVDKIKTFSTERADGFLMFNCAKSSFTPVYYTSCLDEFCDSPLIDYAINKANSARFEFLNK